MPISLGGANEAGVILQMDILIIIFPLEGVCGLQTKPIHKISLRKGKLDFKVRKHLNLNQYFFLSSLFLLNGNNSRKHNNFFWNFHQLEDAQSLLICLFKPHAF